MSSLVYVSGAAMTPFGKSESSLADLLIKAGRGALADAKTESVDAVYLGIMNPAEFTGDSNLAALVADRLELPGVPSSRVETASSTGMGVLETAFYAVASGYVKRALVIAGERMTHLPTSQTTKILARVIDKVERQYGASMPALAAMIARRYAADFNLSDEELGQALCAVAVKNHANGSLNPYAQFRKVLTAEKYYDSKVISDPLRIYDCAPITDGAAAMVLSLDKTGVGLVGMGHATDTLAVGRRGKLTSFNSTKQAAMKAYRMANVNPEDVDMAEVHDAFTAFEIIGSEDLGFFEAGQGARAAMDGKTARNGEMPINASGGLKARGHPVGASGLAQVVELVWQMRGQVEPERQLERTRVGLAQSIGGLANNNLVTILMRTDHRRVWQVSFEPNYHRELVPPRPLLEEEKRYYGRGELLTYTTLYSPPEGFKPPLDLGYVRMGDGAVILAHGQADPMPKLGEKVSVDVEGEHFVFRNYDPGAVWRRRLGSLGDSIWGWWGSGRKSGPAPSNSETADEAAEVAKAEQKSKAKNLSQPRAK